MRGRTLLPIVALMASSVVFGVVGVAGAESVACGTEISSDTVLQDDLLQCPGDGLVVTADGVTLDLNGHRVSGSFRQYGEAQAAGGQFAGIRLRMVSGVRVVNGTVDHFAAGVAVMGGGEHTLSGLTVEDNVGPPGTDNLGDGIVVFNSTENAVTGNTVRRNGPLSGVALVGNSDDNRVADNEIVDNDHVDVCAEDMLVPPCRTGQPVWSQDAGVRVEGPGAQRNLVAGNRISGSGISGILVSPTCQGAGAGCTPATYNTDNVIRGNVVTGNGFAAFRRRIVQGNVGHGIHVFAAAARPPLRTLIDGNVVWKNAGHGIALDQRVGTTTVTSNVAAANGQQLVSAELIAYDARDANDNCGAGETANVWRDNLFESVNQSCVQDEPGDDHTHTHPSGIDRPRTAGDDGPVVTPRRW